MGELAYEVLKERKGTDILLLLRFQNGLKQRCLGVEGGMGNATAKYVQKGLCVRCRRYTTSYVF